MSDLTALNEELNQLTKENVELRNEVRKYRAAIELHRKEVRRDPCHEHDSELWKILGDHDTDWWGPLRTPMQAMEGCLLYLKTHEFRLRQDKKIERLEEDKIEMARTIQRLQQSVHGLQQKLASAPKGL